MALSRIENEILVYRQSLEKAVADEGEKNSEMMVSEGVEKACLLTLFSLLLSTERAYS